MLFLSFLRFFEENRKRTSRIVHVINKKSIRTVSMVEKDNTNRLQSLSKHSSPDGSDAIKSQSIVNIFFLLFVNDLQLNTAANMVRSSTLSIADSVACLAVVSHIRQWFQLSVNFLSFLNYYKYRLNLFSQDIVKCRVQVNQRKYKNLVHGFRVTVA